MDKVKEGKRPPKGPGIIKLLKPYRGLIIILLVFALLSNALNLLLPHIIAHSIDDYTNGTFALHAVLLEFITAALFIFIFTYVQSIIQTYASERVARDVRTQLAGKISEQSYAYVQDANPSKLLTNLTSDIDSIKMFVSLAVVSIASSVFIIVGASVLLIITDWKLALVVLSIIPVIAFAFFTVLRKVRVLFKQSREVIDRLNKVINESILGAALIRVLNAQQHEYGKFIDANTKSKNLGLSILKLFATLIPIITFLANMAMLSILALGGRFVINGSMTLGDFAAFNSYLSLLIFPIIVIGFMSNIIAQATTSYQRIHGILERPDTPDEGTEHKQLDGAVELRSVSLNLGGRPVLKNVSFTVEAGSRTAIIGPTASGKTQLLNLMTGLLLPDEGEILYDHIPVAAYNKQALLSQVGLVFQDSILFNMTLQENIAFNEKVSDADMHKAIATAELETFINTLPEKLDAMVSERGTSLSGGQKQRIMLARALAINPKVLLLDDFTARVDTNTEQKILHNVQHNYPGITLISVTQKIASVMHFDQIILLMEGEVIAKGTHDELMTSCPEYVQIYNSQRSTSNYEL